MDETVGDVAKLREPNRLLAAAMAEAGVSNNGLAKRVRDLGQADDQTVRCDHVDVKRWLDGMVPKEPKRTYVAKALSAKLGRRISAAEVGFGESEDQQQALADSGTDYPEHADTAIGLLDTLAEGDLADNPSVTAARWAADVAPQVITGYLFADPVSPLAVQTEPVSGPAVAGRIRDTAASLMQMDFQWGGGHVRRMLLGYFRDQVVPELRKEHTEATRREVFSAAAEVAQLLGWSAYDAGRHGAAIRYFVQGLKLAREANDHMQGGRLLANLSHQANFLGNYGDAVKFARAAQNATYGHATKNVEAMYVMMEARGLANVGDRSATATMLNRAELLLDQRDPAREPSWIWYYDLAEFAGDASHCFRDLGLADETKRFVSRALAPETPPRTRAFIQMVSAAGSLAGGELEEALTLATDAVHQGRGLKSARYARYLTDFRASLEPRQAGHPLVHEFDQLLREHGPEAAA